MKKAIEWFCLLNVNCWIHTFTNSRRNITRHTNDQLFCLENSRFQKKTRRFPASPGKFQNDLPCGTGNSVRNPFSRIVSFYFFFFTQKSNAKLSHNNLKIMKFSLRWLKLRKNNTFEFQFCIYICIYTAHLYTYLQ